MRLGLLAAGVALVLCWAPPGTGAQPPTGATSASPAYALSARPARAPAAAANELVLEHGRAVPVHDPYLNASEELPVVTGAAHAAPSPDTPDTGAAAPRARAASSSGPSVSVALKSLESSAAITPQQHAQYLSDYEAAKHSLTKLTGTRQTELGAVIANLQAMAAAGAVIPSRLPVLFLTLDDNRLWWTSGPLLSADQHVAFPNSHLVWEYYPGQGIEIQWLATFGEANGYYSSGTQNSSLSALLQEMIDPLATQRAGGIAWEYLFNFDGGAPPWTSGLSQGTAIQALARGWSRLHNQAYLTAAQQALGLFQTPPPAGVRVPTAAGATYLQYSFAPSERIINGFVQSLVGLYDYTSLTGDPLGEQLFAAGDAEARVEVPTYDTGAWSMYDQSSESDLSYHDLLTTFLTNLCQRTDKTVTPLSLAPRDAVSESTRGKAQARTARAEREGGAARLTAPGAAAAPGPPAQGGGHRPAPPRPDPARPAPPRRRPTPTPSTARPRPTSRPT